MIAVRWKMPILVGVIASPFVMSACTTGNATDGMSTGSVRSYGYTARDKECLARAMFFESVPTSRDGLVAVGSVVMNRLRSGEFGDTVCGVVGQKGQFAPGVLSRPMNSAALPGVTAAAEAVLKGERHPKVPPKVMFFHTAGLKFPYKNMHYTTVAGGNAFYEKRRRTRPSAPAEATTQAAAEQRQSLRVVEAARSANAATAATEAALDGALAFQPTAKQADVIGALLLSQGRPRETTNGEMANTE